MAAMAAMADDRDAIAWLYPYDTDPLGRAAATVQLNADRLLMPALKMDEEGSFDGGEDAPTPLPDPEDENKQSYLYTDGIRLGFDTGPGNSEGFVIGRKPTCDVVLPTDHRVLKGISARQCVLTFDELDRLVLYDIRDPHTPGDGTSVSYNERKTGKRRGFKWILAGDPIANRCGDIRLVLHERIIFRLHIAYHNLHPANVARFRQAAGLAIQGLTLASLPSTVSGSLAETPHGAGSVFLDQALVGKGAFGAVWQVWDVSTGRIYARKRPTVDTTGHSPRAQELRKRWLAEVAAMKAISHPNLVQLAFSEDTPVPALYMEYLSLGNLVDQGNLRWFTQHELWAILTQGLDGRQHLHARNIVHRDIKPENILVSVREEHSIQIKLADFGLAKMGGSLKTPCGTPIWNPPELYVNRGDHTRRFTPVVDIWSLGVVLLSYECSLPSPAGSGYAWCCYLVSWVAGARGRELADFLADHMLVMDPRYRSSAAACVQRLLDRKKGDALQEQPPSGNGEYQGLWDAPRASGGMFTQYIQFPDSTVPANQLPVGGGAHQEPPDGVGEDFCADLGEDFGLDLDQDEAPPGAPVPAIEADPVEQLVHVHADPVPVPRPSDTMFLQHGEARIAYDPLRQIANATHVARAGAVNSSALSRFFSRNAGIWREIWRGGRLETRGTYVRLCDLQLIQQRFPTIPGQLVEALADACAGDRGYNNQRN